MLTKASWREITFGLKPSCFMGQTPLNIANIKDITFLPRSSAAVGFRNATALATAVPSVIITEERNVLLNPLHSDYKSLVWMRAAPVSF